MKQFSVPITIYIIQNYSTINTPYINTSAVTLCTHFKILLTYSTGFLSIHDASLACLITLQCYLHYDTLATKSAPPFAITVLTASHQVR